MSVHPFFAPRRGGAGQISGSSSHNPQMLGNQSSYASLASEPFPRGSTSNGARGINGGHWHGASDVDDTPSVAIDPILCREWIYPTNKDIRQYQCNIAKNALTWNTLVVLPTGLGKTLIAAVVMYNYYRWFPTGKIVFMAPTKPLVAQQIEACHVL